MHKWKLGVILCSCVVVTVTRQCANVTLFNNLMLTIYSAYLYVLQISIIQCIFLHLLASSLKIPYRGDSQSLNQSKIFKAQEPRTRNLHQCTGPKSRDLIGRWCLKVSVAKNLQTPKPAPLAVFAAEFSSAENPPKKNLASRICRRIFIRRKSLVSRILL